MSSSHKSAYDNSPTIAIIVGVSMVSLFLTILWLAARQKIAHLYGLLRSIEFPFVWKIVPGSEQFQLPLLLRGYVPPVESIFLHSVYFGIVFFALILVTMLLALIRLEKFSIAPHMAVNSKHGLTPEEAMDMYADTIPYVRFYQRFDLLKLSTVEGDARQPMTAMEVLEASGAVLGVDEDYSSGRMPTIEVDFDKLAVWLKDRMGPKNPFKGFEKPRLERANQVNDTIDKLPWETLLILYPSIWRRHSFLVEDISDDDADGFKAAKVDIDDFIERTWIELNKLCAEYGERLHIGFDNEGHRAIQNSLYLDGKKAKTEGLISLHEMLNERGADMQVVTEARKGLKRILTAHLGHDTNLFPVRIGRDGRMEFATKAETASEKAYLAMADKKLKNAAKKISAETIFAHNYVFGLVGSALENARETGVMQPHLFNWLRFHDKPLWYFVHNLGMPTAVPENAASFEHYQAERVAKTSISKPFVKNCLIGLRAEADKYLVEEERDRLRSEYGGRSVNEAVKSMFKDLMNGTSAASDNVEGASQANQGNTAPETPQEGDTVKSGTETAIRALLRSAPSENAENNSPENSEKTGGREDDGEEKSTSRLGIAKSGLGGFF